MGCTRFVALHGYLYYTVPQNLVRTCEIGNLNCLRHFSTSAYVTNLNWRKKNCFLHTCASCFELPSYISIMLLCNNTLLPKISTKYVLCFAASLRYKRMAQPVIIVFICLHSRIRKWVATSVCQLLLALNNLIYIWLKVHSMPKYCNSFYNNVLNELLLFTLGSVTIAICKLLSNKRKKLTIKYILFFVLEQTGINIMQNIMVGGRGVAAPERKWKIYI